MIEIGLTHTSQLAVTEAVTAIEMGSGDMPVLATPAMMALMENAAMLAVADYLPEGSTATVTRVDGKKIEFKVEARSGETLLGEGTHLRFIVDKEKFMSRL